MSIKFEEDQLKQLVDLISQDRLNSLIALTGSHADAVALHQNSLRLGLQMMNLIAIVEIALRNAVCSNLNAHFGGLDWLIQPPLSFQWKTPDQRQIQKAHDNAQRSVYAKKSQAEKSALDHIIYPDGRPAHLAHAKRVKDRRQQIQVSTGQVITELTLYFWKRLFGPDYEQHLWRTSLKRIFPNKKIDRANIAIQLEHIYQARNRIAHHEPVLHKRFTDTIAAISFIASNLLSKVENSRSALYRLMESELAQVQLNAHIFHQKLDSYRGK